MSSYVNLLQESEIQYRPMALDKRGLKLGAVALVLAVVAGLAMMYRNYSALVDQAAELQAKWAKLEGEQTQAKARLETVKAVQARTSELRGWSEARLDIASVLDNLAALVPQNLQIRKLECTGTLAGVEGEAATTTAGKKLPAPERRYSILLQGVIVGTDTEPQVIGFLDALKTAPFKDLLASARLVETGKLRQPDGTPDPLTTQFSIELKFKPRPLVWKKST